MLIFTENNMNFVQNNQSDWSATHLAHDQISKKNIPAVIFITPVSYMGSWCLYVWYLFSLGNPTISGKD